MRHFLLAVFLVAGLLQATPVFAQSDDDEGGDADQPAVSAPQQPGEATIAVDPSEIGNDDGYAEAVQKLSPEQQQYLQYLDSELAKVIEPNLVIADMAGKLNHCLHNGQIGADERKKYALAFISFEEQHQQAENDLWARHQALRDKATFIDHDLLEKHANFQAKSMIVMSGKMLQSAEKNGNYDKTDCGDVRNTLDALPPPSSVPQEQQQ